LDSFFACQKNKPTDDPEKLKSVLLAYFDGITNKDFKKIKCRGAGILLPWNNQTFWPMT